MARVVEISVVVGDFLNSKLFGVVSTLKSPVEISSKILLSSKLSSSSSSVQSIKWYSGGYKKLTIQEARKILGHFLIFFFFHFALALFFEINL